MPKSVKKQLNRRLLETLNFIKPPPKYAIFFSYCGCHRPLGDIFKHRYNEEYLNDSFTYVDIKCLRRISCHYPYFTNAHSDNS